MSILNISTELLTSVYKGTCLEFIGVGGLTAILIDYTHAPTGTYFSMSTGYSDETSWTSSVPP